MPISKTLTNHLDKNKIKYEILKHKTVFTVYDKAQTLKKKLNEIAKTLLVKADKEYWLVVLPAHLKLDFGKLKKMLKAKKISIAPEKEMKTKLGVKPGTITPFATIHKKIGIMVDNGLLKTQHVILGAGTFNESIRMKAKDYFKLESPQKGAIGKSAGIKLQVKGKKKK